MPWECSDRYSPTSKQPNATDFPRRTSEGTRGKAGTINPSCISPSERSRRHIIIVADFVASWFRLTGGPKLCFSGFNGSPTKKSQRWSQIPVPKIFLRHGVKAPKPGKAETAAEEKIKTELRLTFREGSNSCTARGSVSYLAHTRQLAQPASCICEEGTR